MDYRVTFRDNGQVRRLLGADRVFAQEVETAVRTSSLDGEGRSKRVIREKDRIDLSQLINSVAADPVRHTGTNVIGGWHASSEHARVNEFGRRAGKPMPPKGVLLPWMARHGIPEEAEFAVRRRIGIRGIPGIFFMRTARDEVRPRFRAAMRQAVARSLRRIGGG